jgi:hypothetical protein
MNHDPFSFPFGRANVIRRDRPLTREELFCVVPSVFSEDKHASRSERYTCIPTITLLENLQREGFQPFFACQTRVRDQGKREHTKHMLRLRREGQITGHQVPEIILLNSHDGSSSYQMLPGLFRMVCQNGLICGESFGEVRVPHKGDVVERVIEGAYEVLDVFDRVDEKARGNAGADAAATGTAGDGESGTDVPFWRGISASQRNTVTDPAPRTGSAQ